tara:strand:+ start:305 stop:610 length:306 start_codon:yes stop_codon:yes gene_type:complete
MDKNKVNLLDPDVNFIQDNDRVMREHSQKISKAFLDDLKDSRNQTSDVPSGEFLRVASIPTGVVEKWLREGFNVWEASGKEIVKRLKNENLDYFLATDKRI